MKALGGLGLSLICLTMACQAQLSSDERVFDRFLEQAKAQKLDQLKPGSQLVAIGQFFIGTPYVGGTLEADGSEALRINLRELDCTTLIENALALHLTLQNNHPDFDQFKRNLTRVRYRDGCLTDYTSRLHYTADWLSNNRAKGLIEFVFFGDSTARFPLAVNYMSTHPESYPALKANPAFVPVMVAHEKRINSLNIGYIPKDRVRSAYPFIETGDIVAITTNTPGLDYSHVGLAIKEASGVVKLLHASSSAKQVVVTETDLYTYLMGVKRHTGITVVRAF